MSSIQAQNVNHPSHRGSLKEEKYTIVREAILVALPDENNHAGMPFSQLEDKVRAYLISKDVPTELFPKPGSVRWYTKAVQLDLEARKIIERVPKKTPIHLRKVAQK